ncbi:MAG TPA: tail fiber domain-containing protein [Thermoanaerobaculia bacterium]|nr:tail fiber domain-containing protein [Thermoanaerobaculia bacterium]
MANDIIERLRYYQRQYLGAEDFTGEQEYHRSMRRRHNVGHHAWGIVTGLELVEIEPEGGGGGVDVYVLPGMAVDGFGREILMLEPTKLSAALFQPFLNQPGMLAVWIGYAEELAGRPRPGYELCDVPGQLGRVRETFRLAIEPRQPTHDGITLAGHPVEAGAPADPANPAADVSERLAVPADESVPHQQLPDDEDRPRWLVRLGSVNWDGQKLVADQADPPLLNADRRYVRIVAEEVMAPGTTLKLRRRAAPDPLPADPNNPFYFGVVAEVQGLLTVNRLLHAQQDLHVQGKAGIGTNDPKVKLHVVGGTDAGLGEATGFLVLGPTDGVSLVADGNEILARNNGAASALHLQAPGGDLVVHQNQAAARVVVKDSGRVGIGTLDPKAKLHVTGGADASLAGEESGFLVLGPADGLNLVLDDNELMARNAGAKTALHLQAEGGDLVVHQNQAATQVVVKDAGQVGIGTTSPKVKLHVEGGADVALGDNDGFLVLGSVDGANVAFDDNEIQARNNGQATPLFLQNEGGGLFVHTGMAEARQFVVTTNGFVGIGVQAPQVPLHVRQGTDVNLSDNSGFLVVGDVDGLNLAVDDNEIQARNNGAASTLHLQAEGGGLETHFFQADPFKLVQTAAGDVGIGTGAPLSKLDVRGTVRVAGFINTSDTRLKRDLKKLEGTLAAVARLRGVRFRWDPERAQEFGFEPGPQLGFVAQEVEEVFPEAVHTDEQGYKSVKTLDLLPLLVEAVKELNATVEKLDARVKKLESRKGPQKGAPS